MKKIILILVILILILFSSLTYAAAVTKAAEETGIKIKSFSGEVYAYADNILNEPLLSQDLFPEPRSSGTLDSAPGPVSSHWVSVARTGEGHVESQKINEKGWTPIWNARLLKKGDKVQTLDNGHATLNFKGGASITIGPNTGIELTSDLIKENVNEQKVSIKQAAGRVYVQILNFMGKDVDFELYTPGNGVIGARGTEFEVIVEDDRAEVIVYESSVSMKNSYDETEKIVNAGEKGILYPDKPAEIIPLIDDEPLEIEMANPCPMKVTIATQYTDPLTKALMEDTNPEGIREGDVDCTLTERPKFIFYANKFLDPSTINKETLIVTDETNKPVEGFFEVDNLITFIPSNPIYGKIKILLKKNKICSKTGVCIEKDYTFELNGAKKREDSEVAFELTPSDPVLITREMILMNKGTNKLTDISVTFPSFKNFPPNIYVKFYKISPDIEYEIQEGNNNFIKLKIDELKPGEQLNINISYIGLFFGIESYQRLKVAGLENYADSNLAAKYTKPEEAIESSNPTIIKLSEQIVGDEKNPFWKAYKIYNWITDNIKYNYDEVYSGGAIAALQTEKGICTDYAELFIALARAQGIPTRFVGLHVSTDSGIELHAMAEIYLPDYGWIPIDPTWGTNFDAFARLDPLLFVDFKESSKTKYIYRTEGKNADDVSISDSIKASLLYLSAEEDWNQLFDDPFFKVIYEIILISQINSNINEKMEFYNGLSKKDLLVFPRYSEQNSIILTEKAIDYYNTGKYPEIQEEIQNSIIEQLKLALISYSDLVRQSKQVLEESGFTSFETSTENQTTGLNEKLLFLDNTLSEVDAVNNLLGENNYPAAFNKFIVIYLNSNEKVSEIYNFFSYDVFGSSKDITTKSVIFFIIFIILVPLFFIILGLWMFINCLIRKEFRHLNKFLWVIIILFVFFVGPILYFILEYLNRSLRNSKDKRYKIK